jgi:hypothetical protein
MPGAFCRQHSTRRCAGERASGAVDAARWRCCSSGEAPNRLTEASIVALVAEEAVSVAPGSWKEVIPSEEGEIAAGPLRKEITKAARKLAAVRAGEARGRRRLVQLLLLLLKRWRGDLDGRRSFLVVDIPFVPIAALLGESVLVVGGGRHECDVSMRSWLAAWHDHAGNHSVHPPAHQRMTTNSTALSGMHLSTAVSIECAESSMGHAARSRAAERPLARTNAAYHVNAGPTCANSCLGLVTSRLKTKRIDLIYDI